MTAKKKLLPIDIRDNGWIDAACSFSAAIKTEGGTQVLRELGSMFDAGASATILEARQDDKRKALVYAVTKEGRSTVVPRERWIAEVKRILALPSQVRLEEINRLRLAARAKGE